MDTSVKRGEVYLQHPKHSGKWKRYWLTLHPDSRCGVARLELTEAVSDRSPAMVRRQPERRFVRLAECISVIRLPPHAEACPGDNMAAFCVETEEKRLVFAVDKEDCGQWVEKICDVTFQKNSGISAPFQVPQMEENQIYASRDEVLDFYVTVQPSEAALRCGLRGVYWLQTSEDTLVLKDPESRQTVIEWPYKLLRRYGRDKMMFSIEAGRRCESGPGTFIFETKQGDEILRFMELAIRQQKTLGISGGSGSPRTPSSPLPRRPNSAILLDIYGHNSIDTSTKQEWENAGMGKCFPHPTGSAESEYAIPTISSSSTAQKHPCEPNCLIEPIYSVHIDVSSDKCVYPQPGNAVKSQQTINNARSTQQYEYSEPVYADPADAIRSSPSPQLYVFDSTADKVIHPTTTGTPHQGNQTEPLYAEVFHVAPNSIQKQDNPVQCKEEPIYSLPEVSTSHKLQQDVPTSAVTEGKQDIPSKKLNTEVIYSQVNKAWKSAKLKDKNAAHKGQVVTSEDLGLI